MLHIWIVYGVMCLQIAKDLILEHKIDGKINICFFCDNFTFRKERSDSLPEWKYLFKKNPDKLSEEKD